MKHAVQGNLEVRDLLERKLEEAAKGKVNHALVLTYENAFPTCEIAGVGGLDALVARHLLVLAEKIGALRPLASSGGADQWCYDLALQAYSHDFAAWLVQAEMTRRRENAPAPLRVAFVRKLDGAAEHCKTMLDNVMRPMLPRIGAVEGLHRTGRVNYFCDLKPVVSFATAQKG